MQKQAPNTSTPGLPVQHGWGQVPPWHKHRDSRPYDKHNTGIRRAGDSDHGSGSLGGQLGVAPTSPKPRGNEWFESTTPKGTRFKYTMEDGHMKNMTKIEPEPVWTERTTPWDTPLWQKVGSNEVTYTNPNVAAVTKDCKWMPNLDHGGVPQHVDAAVSMCVPIDKGMALTKVASVAVTPAGATAGNVAEQWKWQSLEECQAVVAESKKWLNGDSQGHSYWFNEATKLSQWEVPPIVTLAHSEAFKSHLAALLTAAPASTCPYPKWNLQAGSYLELPDNRPTHESWTKGMMSKKPTRSLRCLMPLGLALEIIRRADRSGTFMVDALIKVDIEKLPHHFQTTSVYWVKDQQLIPSSLAGLFGSRIITKTIECSLDFNKQMRRIQLSPIGRNEQRSDRYIIRYMDALCAALLCEKRRQMQIEDAWPPLPWVVKDVWTMPIVLWAYTSKQLYGLYT